MKKNNKIRTYILCLEIEGVIHKEIEKESERRRERENMRKNGKEIKRRHSPVALKNLWYLCWNLLLEPLASWSYCQLLQSYCWHFDQLLLRMLYLNNGNLFFYNGSLECQRKRKGLVTCKLLIPFKVKTKYERWGARNNPTYTKKNTKYP